MESRLLKPKLISVFQEGYTRKLLFKDIIAGVIVGIVSLPMAIAFAIASGVRPEQGLYTAIIAGFITSFLGGSRVQIAGPTGAFVILIYTIVQQYGYNGLVIATLMAGIFLLVLGFSRLGAVIKFIPYPVTIGFTSGIAILLFTGQIPDLLGLSLEKVPTDFFERWGIYVHNLSSLSLPTIMLSLIALVILIFWPKISSKIPGPLVVIFVTTFLVKFFDLPVTTIGSRFGQIPSSFPSLHFPEFQWELITQMISPAIAITLLAGIESLLSAVVADGMLGRRHRSDMELIAHGAGNIGSALFQGIPSTGAIARTATNIKSGGRTPIAGIINALVLCFIMLFIGKWISLIPMAALAVILIITAYHMSEWRHFMHLFRSPKSDIAVLLTTFLLTVIVDLTTALEVGIILATFLFMLRMMQITKARSLKKSLEEEENSNDPSRVAMQDVPEEVEVFEIRGPFFFAAIEGFKNALGTIHRTPKILILRMDNVPTIDASGMRALEDVLSKTKREGTCLILSGIHMNLIKGFKKTGFFEQVGEENITRDIDNALKCAKKILASQIKASA